MAFTELYVTSTGAGGHTGADESNALDFGEMLAYGGSTSLAGKSFNVKIGSTYSRTTSTDAFTTTAGAPTAAAPMRVRAYSAAAGDLDANARTSDTGALDSALQAALTYTTGRITFPDYTIVENINVDGATAAASLVTLGDHCIAKNVTANLTHASNATWALDIASGALYNCDATTASNAGGDASAIRASRSAGITIVDRCRVRAPNGSAGIICWTGPVVIVDLQCLDCTRGIQQYTLGAIINPSFRNCSGTHIYRGGSMEQFYVRGTAAWGSGGGSSRLIEGVTAVREGAVLESAVGNMGASDTNMGDWPSDRVALSADPFTSSSNLVLNSTAGGGADCKEADYFGRGDIGAIQEPSASGAAGGLITHPGMSGRMNG